MIEAKSFNLEMQVWIEATELARSTFHMCYVQCAARGLAGRIINGNSLSLETYSLAFTAAAPVFYAQNGDPFAKQKADAEVKAQADQDADDRATQERVRRLEDMKTAEPIKGEQLSLFLTAFHPFILLRISSGERPKGVGADSPRLPMGPAIQFSDKLNMRAPKDEVCRDVQ